MAEHEETGSKADSKRTFESASPFYARTSLHREPQTIEGQTVEEPVAPGFDTSGVYAHPEAAAARETASAVPRDEAVTADPPNEAPRPEAAARGPAAPPPVKRGASATAVLTAAIIGALTGFAGAYATYLLLDDTQTSLMAFDQRLSALNTQLAADETKIDAVSGTNHNALSALEKRLSLAETSAKTAMALATTAQTQTAAAGTTETSAASPAPEGPVPDLTPLQAHIDALDKRLTDLETAFSTAKTAERATEEPESKPDPQAVNAPAIAIIAENLVQKIASGAPFAPEIAALEKLGTDAAKLAVLQPSAATGVATNLSLAETFNRLAPTLAAGEKPASPPDGTIFARLIDHASGLVHISKISDLSGSDLPARIARVKDALAHNDTAAALKEWSDFPETAKAASAQWADAAKARIAAVAGAKAIAADAIANLTKVKS